jgi:hypothetical protein
MKIILTFFTTVGKVVYTTYVIEEKTIKIEGWGLLMTTENQNNQNVMMDADYRKYLSQEKLAEVVINDNAAKRAEEAAAIAKAEAREQREEAEAKAKTEAELQVILNALPVAKQRELVAAYLKTEDQIVELAKKDGPAKVAKEEIKNLLDTVDGLRAKFIADVAEASKELGEVLETVVKDQEKLEALSQMPMPKMANNFLNAMMQQMGGAMGMQSMSMTMEDAKNATGIPLTSTGSDNNIIAAVNYLKQKDAYSVEIEIPASVASKAKSKVLESGVGKATRTGGTFTTVTVSVNDESVIDEIVKIREAAASEYTEIERRYQSAELEIKGGETLEKKKGILSKYGINLVD